ncbi:unnamed protein product [Prorocentrum cordatum]|uniref:cellulose 1,4-beta-cellobiosidase (non-reducing end) n=1 Tax=Prorocentrum cordatum TaxID=2364126 RepID=A0ABN9TW99_9DINO|nr:unnamed protein product [Polarella glacialis]
MERAPGPRDWAARDYAPGSLCINTSAPFQVDAAFPVGADGVLSSMEVTVSQGGGACSLELRVGAAYGGLQDLSAVLAAGVTPVVSYWSDTNLMWLDGKGNDGLGPCDWDDSALCASSVQFYDFTVEELQAPSGAAAASAVPAASVATGAAAELELVSSPPFDCTHGYQNWQQGWSDAKKEWCCRSARLGCEDEGAAPAADECPGSVEVAGYGQAAMVPTGWGYPGAGSKLVEVRNGMTVAPRIGSRLYFADRCVGGVYNNDEYLAVNLLDKTLRYVTDLSGAGCGCNAALYLTSMRHNSNASSCGDTVADCDAYSACGVSCAEIDIQEANQYSWHSTLHASGDASGVGGGYGGGGAAWSGPRDWGAAEYAPGAKCIDTTAPFEVAASFPTDGSGILRAVEVVLSQAGHSCTLSLSVHEYGGMPELSRALSAGMTPTISYWSDDDMLWMDGKGADSKGPCAADSTASCADSVQFYGFSIEPMADRTGPEVTTSQPAAATAPADASAAAEAAASASQPSVPEVGVGSLPSPAAVPATAGPAPSASGAEFSTTSPLSLRQTLTNDLEQQTTRAASVAEPPAVEPSTTAERALVVTTASATSSSPAAAELHPAVATTAEPSGEEERSSSGTAAVPPEAPPTPECPGTVEVVGYGEVDLVPTGWGTPAGVGAEVAVEDGRHVVSHMGSRAYFADTCTAGAYDRHQYIAPNLLGKRLRYTTDVSGAGCGCNAAFYLVSMRQNKETSECGDYYCDANSVCGQSCAEIDIQEGNMHSWHSTLHTRDDPSGLGGGYGGGGDDWSGPRDWTDAEYGPGGKCIDTRYAFNVSAYFFVDSTGILAAMNVTLSQVGSPCIVSTNIPQYEGMLALTDALSAGMTPVLSYWSANDMLWMDGRGKDMKGACKKDAADACSESVKFYDFSIQYIDAEQARSNVVHKTAHNNRASHHDNPHRSAGLGTSDDGDQYGDADPPSSLPTVTPVCPGNVSVDGYGDVSIAPPLS